MFWTIVAAIIFVYCLPFILVMGFYAICFVGAGISMVFDKKAKE